MTTGRSVVDAVVAATGGAAADAFGVTTVDLPAESWAVAATAAAEAGATYLDLITAYDDGDRLAVVAVVATPSADQRVLLRTSVPGDDPVLASLTPTYRGADWHERETHELLGVRFTGHPDLRPLLLPPDAPPTPLRKSVLLEARLAVGWPGDKDPSDSEGRPRRRVPPPGVPADHVPPGASR